MNNFYFQEFLWQKKMKNAVEIYLKEYVFEIKIEIYTLHTR